MSDFGSAANGKLDHAPLSKDWFLPAIECDGSVRTSFDAVLRELKLRGELIVQLRERLSRPHQELDRLSTINREAKELENTLRFRLGILQPERPAAWFRKAPNRDFGPFRTAMLTAPVFSEYEVSEVENVITGLRQCWEEAKTGPLPGKVMGESLWGILLGHHAELNSMAELSGPFAGIRLDNPSQGLPSALESASLRALESASLRAFMLNVCGEFAGVKDRLQLCFDHLWSASEKLWAFQRRQRQSQSHQTKQQGDQKYQEHQHNRRSPRPESGICYAEMEALRYMGFRNRPDSILLKQRYYEMAKRLHPDRTGGSEESFKMLNKAYQVLKSPKSPTL